MTLNPDRLYELLPVIYRQRDIEQGYPLRELLRVLSEQVNLVEADIAQLYENWFIETAQDWAVPYILDLIGYQAVSEAGQPGSGAAAQARHKILFPRREGANFIAYRRRKGTLALLELLSNNTAGWPARAVEFARLLNWNQVVNHLRLGSAQTVDVRWGEALARLDGPFDEIAHTVDVRRINSRYSQGRYNLPNVGLFVWRLKAYPVTTTPAYSREETAPNAYTFSVLGNDSPLYTRPEGEETPTHIAGEMNVPAPVRRLRMQKRLSDYFGQGKSLMIWRGLRDGEREPIPIENLVIADLSGWRYQPAKNTVAVDPELGRIAFPPRQLPKYGVWVSYHYGFSADIGGGEYSRPLSQPSLHRLYRVGEGEAFTKIGDALELWKSERPQHAVIEITDSGVYVEPIAVELALNQTLQLRSAQLKRPVLRLLDWQTDQPDALSVALAPSSHFTLDGLLVTGRGLQVHATPGGDEQFDKTQSSFAGVTIRHSTLVPGWSLKSDCTPQRPAEPSLEVIDVPACVTIEHSIVGAVRINLDTVLADPLPVFVSDSIVDATALERDALCGPGGQLAHAVLTMARTTVFGCICLHAIQLAEDSIFMGRVTVARRQIGCVRFSYVTPGSRTPRRFQCQPDLVEQTVNSQPQRDIERLRVEPQFNSTQYGRPAYAQLALACAPEIKRGAEDQSEMGVFHDLYQPQREANLRARLDEFTPADMQTGIIIAS